MVIGIWPVFRRSASFETESQPNIDVEAAALPDGYKSEGY